MNKIGRRLRTTYFVTRLTESGELETFNVRTVLKARKLVQYNGLGIWRETKTRNASISERIWRNNE